MNTNQQGPHSTAAQHISWGAVFAGLVATAALLWLLLLLGSALGISVLDETNAAALGAGLGWGAIIWVFVSFLIAYFIGGAIAGRLSSEPTQGAGMLHGVTVWSTATVLSLVMAALGIGGLASMATHATDNVAKTTTRVAVDAGEGMQVAQGLLRQFADSELADEMAAAIKTRVAELLADAAEGVEQQETQRAVNEIDAATAAAVSRELVAGQTEEAKQRLARNTDLGLSEINRIIDGLASEINAAIADSQTVERLQSALQDQINEAVRAAADLVGPALSASELRTALDELDIETLRDIAMHLVQGDEGRARNVLTASTSLTEQEVNRVIDQVTAEFEEQMTQWRQQAEEVIEMASDYGQMAVWTMFFASLLALLAAMFGARIGAGRIRQ